MITLDKKNIIVGTSSQVSSRTTDPNGTIYLVTDQAVVEDVTVNGNSVVSDGVAAITVPTNNNQLTNGAGYITDTDLATVATTGAYSDLSGTPTIPAAVSVSATGTSTNNVEYITIGSDEYHLAGGGGGGGMTNPMTTAGDIIVGGESGNPIRLAKGTSNHTLRCGLNSSDPIKWSDLYLHVITITVKAGSTGSDTVTFQITTVSNENRNLTCHGSSMGNLSTYSARLDSLLTNLIGTDGTTTPAHGVFCRQTGAESPKRVYYRKNYGIYLATVSISSTGSESVTLGTVLNQGSDAFVVVDKTFAL